MPKRPVKKPAPKPKPRPRAWHVYLLRCADGTLYCGITNNLKKRTAAHNCGKGAKYTRSRGPVVIVWSKRCASMSAALKLEYKTKQLTRAEKGRLFEAPIK
jgi:putative endonuclease